MGIAIKSASKRASRQSDGGRLSRHAAKSTSKAHRKAGGNEPSRLTFCQPQESRQGRLSSEAATTPAGQPRKSVLQDLRFSDAPCSSAATGRLRGRESESGAYISTSARATRSDVVILEQERRSEVCSHDAMTLTLSRLKLPAVLLEERRRASALIAASVENLFQSSCE